MFLFLYIAVALMLAIFSLRYYEQKKLVPKQYLISERIIHWGTFVLVLGLFFTAIMNTNYYSRDAIMKTFEFSMPLVGLHDVDLDAKLFIARYERRIAWDHHFIMGVMLIALTIPWIISYMLRKKKSNFIKFTFWSYIALIALFTFTGLVLHMGNWIEIDYDFRERNRDFHKYGYYLMYGWFAIHIFVIIGMVLKTKMDIIGKMIHGGKELKKTTNNKVSNDVNTNETNVVSTEIKKGQDNE